MPKLVAVVGAKHTGKTTIIERLIVELKSRGYHLGVIKEMVRIPMLDTPQKETDRYAKAGAETIAALPRNETVIFIKKRLTIKEILPHLSGLDYALLEGFESEKGVPKIIAAKTAEEISDYLDGSVIAVSGILADSEANAQVASSIKIQLLSSSREIKELANLVEEKAV
jgi:molybdopterin-guanine dinucleotide biosynthesis protein B